MAELVGKWVRFAPNGTNLTHFPTNSAIPRAKLRSHEHVYDSLFIEIIVVFCLPFYASTNNLVFYILRADLSIYMIGFLITQTAKNPLCVETGYLYHLLCVRDIKHLCFYCSTGLWIFVFLFLWGFILFLFISLF